MVLSASISIRIVNVAREYLGKSFDYEKFNCVHFVRSVYSSVGINFPILNREDFPPNNLHLSDKEFFMMPIGHSVFFKRKASTLNRNWTHVAIIISPNELIHCSRRFGGKVVITAQKEFLEIYSLAPKSP